MIRQMIELAFRSLSRNKIRTFITMLGIVIGIASVSVMVSYGQGMQKQIESRITSMGVNLLTIFPSRYRSGGVSTAGANRLTYADYETLKKEALTLAGITPLARSSATISTKEESYSTTLSGVSADFPLVRNWSLKWGEFFSEEEEKGSRFVCVLGYTTSTALFGEEVNPVGQQIKIQNSLFNIIGVLQPKGSSGPQDEDDVVFVPYTTYRLRLNQSRYIPQILASSLSKNTIEESIDEITSILRRSHRLRENVSNDFRILNQSEMLETAQTVSSSLTLFLVSIAAISLLVGGIGIMNIMLVSVVERTREIGIRMAVGAREQDILWQFLTESLLLCIMGGILGLIAGIFFSLLLRQLLEWNIVFSWPVFAFSFAVTLLIGIGFGYYPAQKASKLNPIDALRYE
ncbi:ABC transporter permease [Thermospira aquatica]|uniref:ABC transporter permease n=1 Tax=Thermospira aquatica TaxID=2828656 RepID=A0AAX3BBU4_9SPIR|nr:ABC transporter permease [Thermospira aquatica]URA09713.1 ABC transporter permease [Thermospira aquatica]